MIVAQALRRNRKITITTRAMESMSVNSTSCTEARMVCVRSTMVRTWMVGGISASSRGNAALIRSTVAMTLAPGCLNITSSTPLWPFCQDSNSRFCGPRVAVPISRTRIGAPLRYARIRLAYGAGSVSWSLSCTVNDWLGPSRLPLGPFTVAFTSVPRTSSNVMPILASLAGSMSMRMAGFCWPPTETWLTPVICDSCWLRTFSA